MLFNKEKTVVDYNEGEDDNEVQMEDAGAGEAAETPRPAAPAPPKANLTNQGSVKRASPSDKMASAANGAGLVDEGTSQEVEWHVVEGNKKPKVAKVATVVESIKQTLSTPVRTRQSSVPVIGHSTPKAGASMPRRAHCGIKPPATTPKTGGEVSYLRHPPTFLTPEGGGGGGGGGGAGGGGPWEGALEEAQWVEISPSSLMEGLYGFLTFIFLIMDYDRNLKLIKSGKGFLLCRGFFFIRPHIQQCAILILSGPLVLSWRFSNIYQYGGP